jgi:RNA polymerase sigma factor (sigma-70 family)
MRIEFMDERNWLAQRFEENRGHMRGVAYRMLGSLSEADDAVQETWLRLSRSEAGSIQNLSGWLTTVIARVCLDMLRSRKSRAEESLDEPAANTVANKAAAADPEQEVLLADSVGIALLVILERLTPAERLAFVLHDVFAVPFEEIAPIVERTPEAARQLASRARRRVQGSDSALPPSRTEQRAVVNEFLAALRRGDVEGLVSVLDPDVLVKVEGAGGRPGAPKEVRGARNWATGAVAFSQSARFAEAVLVDGAVGAVFAPKGKLFSVLSFTFTHGKIVQVRVITDPARLRELELGVLEN